jgi:hypothetical protein
LYTLYRSRRVKKQIQLESRWIYSRHIQKC